MSPRSARGAIAALTKDAEALLRKLADGNRLTGARTFPYPHKFSLRGSGWKETSVPVGRVSQLVESGFVEARPYGGKKGEPSHTDFVEYAISEKGRRALEGGGLTEPDGAQIEALPEAIRPRGAA